MPLGVEGQQAAKAVRLRVIRPAQDNAVFRGQFEACRQVLEARGPDDLEAAVRAATKERAGALLVLGSPVFNSSRRRIAELTNKNRLPTIMPFPGFAEDGGLMAYGPHLHSLFSQAGAMLVKVLKGSPPSDLPVERPTTISLIVNLRTAKTLGVVMPQSLLTRADEVIQ